MQHTSQEPQQDAPPSLKTGPMLAKPSYSSARGESSPMHQDQPLLETLAPYLHWPTVPPICGKQPGNHHVQLPSWKTLPTREPKAQCMRETVISSGSAKPESLLPEKPSHFSGGGFDWLVKSECQNQVSRWDTAHHSWAANLKTDISQIGWRYKSNSTASLLLM